MCKLKSLDFRISNFVLINSLPQENVQDLPTQFGYRYMHVSVHVITWEFTLKTLRQSVADTICDIELSYV